MSLSNSAYVNLLKKWECQDSSYLKAEPPLVFKKAKGSTIWDAEGKPYIDLCAGFGVLSLGHNNEVQEEVFRQSWGEQSLIMHGMGDVYPSVDKAELLAYLGGILPSHLSKGAFALSGGQAVEIAVKTAQLATKKQGFICFDGAYHGLDLGILPLTSRRDFKEPFEKWIPGHYATELPFLAQLDEVEKAIIAQNKSSFGCAAVLVEPIQGRAGFRIPPIDWLKGLAELCHRHGALLIFDEIFTGLGRTGKMSFADQVPCDLLCLGKALGGGLPLSACFGREEVMNAWPMNEGEAIHTGTFFGHPLSCRLGLATLKAIHERNLPERALEMGQMMRVQLGDLLAFSPLVKEIRGVGLMSCVELVAPGLGAQWMDLLRAHGVIALANGMQGQGIAITPALTITEEEWALALAEMPKTLRKLSS